jgi:hypothetical protein
MIQRADPWHTRSTLSKLTHVLERLGLALIGTSTGLFVGAAIAAIDLIGSAEVLLAMMLYGATAFYLGIDLPQASPGQRVGLSPRHRLRIDADMLEVLAAVGIFLTAVAAVVSVFSIILDETLASRTAGIICSGWAIGASMQIAAGVIARIKLARAERSAKQALFFR